MNVYVRLAFVSHFVLKLIDNDILFRYEERRALVQGITDLFILSTHTMQWFEERGFVSADPSVLPASREYNSERASRVYVKKLLSHRDSDMQEIMWNIQ